MAIVTEGLVQRISNNAERWLEPVQLACDNWAIDTEARVYPFLAQTAHESAGFNRLAENLRYSAARLLEVWPTRFTKEDAVRMERDEYAIAERAYGGRYGNGPEGSGDGYKYRGSGLIQLTFLDNFRLMGGHLGGVEYPDVLVEHPELVREDPEWAAGAAGCFWYVHGCNELADAGEFDRITRIINPAMAGAQERRDWLKIILREAQ